jgi:hypothetical protein
MLPNWPAAAGLIAVIALATGTAEPARAQVDAFGSCDRTFDLDPATPEPSTGSCRASGIVFGPETLFAITGSAQAVRTSEADFYDVHVTISAPSGLPDGLLYGHVEVRSTNGETCGFDVSNDFVGSTCQGMFSTDGAFTIFVEAISGALPG